MNIHMMQFQPEISLDKDLRISYPQEVLDWVKDNSPGMKYIAIKKVELRGKFKQIMRISLQESPSSGQKPEESPSTICETIYKVLQYDVEGEDAPCKYRLAIYRKMERGEERPFTKHVDVGTDSSGDMESNIFDPSKKDNYDLLDRAIDYIDRLQDTVTGMNNFASQIIGPILLMNKELQQSNIQLGSNMVRMKEIELIAEREREAARLELELGLQKVAASKEKFNTAMKTMNKNGALDKLVGQVASKFLGDGSNQAEIKPPPPKKQTVKLISPPQERVVQPPKINEEELKKQMEKQIEEEMRISPLYTSCHYLKLSLNQEEEENPENSIKEFIKETLSESLYNDFTDLLNSENEQDAKNNLIALQENITMEDYPKLLEIQNRLTEGQKKIIGKILNYREEEKE